MQHCAEHFITVLKHHKNTSNIFCYELGSKLREGDLLNSEYTTEGCYFCKLVADENLTSVLQLTVISMPPDLKNLASTEEDQWSH
jgi:hypothetical protein